MGLTLGWMSCKHWIKTSSVPRLSELQQQNSTVNTHSSCWAKFANYNFCANPLADTSRSAHRRIADHQNIRGAVLADGGMQTFMVWQSADDRPNGLNLYPLSTLFWIDRFQRTWPTCIFYFQNQVQNAKDNERETRFWYWIMYIFNAT